LRDLTRDQWNGTRDAYPLVTMHPSLSPARGLSRATLVRAYTRLRSELFALASNTYSEIEFPVVPRETTDERALAFDVDYLANTLLYTDAEIASLTTESL
jgi:hypothetical protein